jgi:hypothetical protein
MASSNRTRWHVHELHGFQLPEVADIHPKKEQVDLKRPKSDASIRQVAGD